MIAPLLRKLEGSIDTCLHHIGSESFNGSSGLKTSHTRVGSCVETQGVFGLMGLVSTSPSA